MTTELEPRRDHERAGPGQIDVLRTDQSDWRLRLPRRGEVSSVEAQPYGVASTNCVVLRSG